MSTQQRTVLFPGGGPQLKESLADYARRGGFEALRKVIAGFTPLQVIEEIAKAGLRGRGGAGFPTAQKLSLCAAAEGSEKYVVVNGGEDEPGSFKDRTLLVYSPHAVLEGALIAAYAIGASRIIFYINETYHSAQNRVLNAIGEAVGSNYAGEQILGSKFSARAEIFKAPTPYVAGEDTAALEAIEGKPAKPRPKPPYPVTVGLHGKPTVVNNVETLANIPPILLHGAAWYRTIGTSESFGTMLYSLNDEWTRPGIYELPYGAREGELLHNLAGGLKSGAPLRAVLHGGPSSAFLLPDSDRILSPESLRAAGSSIGCGVTRGYGEGTCMVEVALEISRFFEKECCGQCPACQMETKALAATLEKIRRGQVPAAALDQIPRLIQFNKGKGFCSLINMPGPPLTSALNLFRADFDAHIATGKCPSV
ncbi:MAG TPA: NADH-ubiquinone oxidoreductase-F iron-sulfur binding region domain-containing protein [Terriglobia bacterium]|nr:NADH-ubiquinone oxidoreductase-F iron-sulfur binding region domain-containing protein [Terriglobia bacterium]